MIDVEDIIGKRNYYVGLPPEEIFSKIHSNLCIPVENSTLAPWRKNPFSGDRFRTYAVNLVYLYVLDNCTLDNYEEKWRGLENKYYDLDVAHDIIDSIRSDIPYEISILLKNVNELGCECEATCHPTLYTKLSKGIIEEDDVDYFVMQSSEYNCLKLLDEIFIGILGGKIKKDDLIQRYNYKFLLNDSSNREITSEINKLFEEATTEVLICGWMGTHYLPILKRLKSQGVNVRFITHKPGEAKGQPWKSEVEEAYKEICSDFGLESVSNAQNIHGRILIVDNKALIGSMDLNSYSLTGAHSEFAILTDDPTIVRRMRAVFNSKFQPIKKSE